METRRGGLTVTTAGRDLEISGARIRVRLVFRDGGYAEEFYAADSRGVFHLMLSSLHKNLIVASEHRSCTSPMIGGDRGHLFGVSRDSLRMVYSSATVERHTDEKITILLTGTVGPHSLKCWINVEVDSNVAYVVCQDTIARTGADPVIEYLMSSYAFVPGTQAAASVKSLDYAWAPNLRPAADHIIGDCAFHSPAIIVQQGQAAAAMIPDLDLLEGNRQMPAALDLDLDNGLLFAPLLSYGMCGYEPTDDARHCRHDLTMSARLMRPRLVYGFYLLLDCDCKPGGAVAPVARFLWERYAVPRGSARPRPEIRYLRAPIPDPELAVRPDAWAAYGRHARGSAVGDENMTREGRCLIDLLLESAQDQGLFPAQFAPGWGDSSRPLEPADERYYHTVECSQQHRWLLAWHKDVREDERILALARSYADFLIESRLRTGAIPSWFTTDLVPISTLRSSAQTAISALFLAELAERTGIRKYLHAAEQSARFLLREIVPGRRFTDYTLLDPQLGRSFDCADPHTSVYPRSAQAMTWLAHLFIELHRLTGNAVYLGSAQQVFDELCLFQRVHDGSWGMEQESFGLCVRGNMGWKPDPQLSAEFGVLALSIGATAGRRDYFERGVSALRAAQSADETAEISRARIAACAAQAQTRFGTAYVHVAGKWGEAVSETPIRALDVTPGHVHIELAGHANGDTRIVFGGLRAARYKVIVNGRAMSYSRDEMARGVSPPPCEPSHQQLSLEAWSQTA